MALFSGFGVGTIDQVIHSLTKSRVASRQHALFGSVAFDLITYFTGMSIKHGANYAEHALIGRKPQLQWLGDGLDELSYDIVLHAGFCNPESEYLKLKQVVANHEAQALVYSSGDYKGRYIAQNLEVTYKHSDSAGSALWIECKLMLKEYVEPIALTESTPKKDGKATEKKGKKAGKPARTVKKQAKARPKSAGTCRR